MKKFIFRIDRFASGIFILILLASGIASAQTVWLDQLNLSNMTCGWNYYPMANKSVAGKSLTIDEKVFKRGVGTNPVSAFLLNLDGQGKRFIAYVGLDDCVKTDGHVSFFVLGDKKILWQSGTMKRGEPAKEINIDVEGVKQLGLLVTEGGRYDCADWCDARIEMKKNLPVTVITPKRNYYVLTPKAPNYPEINSAKVFGTRPGNPFLYTIGASGKRPMKFMAENLPAGLKLDSKTGQINGTINSAGKYMVTLIAVNKFGKAKQNLTISVDKDIALTPPMGWNSWNAFGKSVTEKNVHDAAEELVKDGLIDYGWKYVIVDGGWTVNPEAGNSPSGGTPYDSKGRILPNRKFPDMPGLSKYIHSLGLDFGLHTSPGPGTCANWAALYGHERPSAEEFAEWGVDYIKYDWCSYTQIAKNNSLPELQKPFLKMRRILDSIPRDIVFSINPGPAGRKADPWKWGKDVGANMWRTTGDINDSWQSVFHIGFSQIHGKYAEPGHWNDPDMLEVGYIGLDTEQHPSKLTPDEQYTHVSLWCLLSAPLMLGCDLTKLDAFTKNLITNREVLAVDQDPLGNEAERIYDKDGRQIWAKNMSDGSKAVGLFWSGVEPKNPTDYFRWKDEKSITKITLNASELGFKGKFEVRDLWRHKNLGTFQNSFTAEVPYHGCVLIQIKSVK